MEKETIGYRIRRERRFAGLTMEELGRKLGIEKSPAQRVAQWEYGYRRPDAFSLVRLEETLDLSPGTLTKGLCPDPAAQTNKEE